MGKSRTLKAKILAQAPAARERDAQDRKRGRRAIAVTFDRRTGGI